jgi:hypothetical protein
MRSIASALMAGALSLGSMAWAQGEPRNPPPATSLPAAGCPCMQGGRMMGGGPMMGQANVTVENTSGGAIIRLTTRDPSRVQGIQRRAQMMASCMGGAAPSAQPGSQATPPK